MRIREPSVQPSIDLATRSDISMTPVVIEPSKLSGDNGAFRDAYERGGEAGMHEMEGEENPYPAGSALAKAFEHGYLDGQKARR